MEPSLYIVGLTALAAIVAQTVAVRQAFRLTRDRSERDGRLIDRLADKVASNTDLQLDRIRIEAKAAEATAEAARAYTDIARRNGQHMTDEEEESEIASRG